MKGDDPAAQIRGFEEVFEPLGLTALAIQVLTGLWMGWIYLPCWWASSCCCWPPPLLWPCTPGCG